MKTGPIRTPSDFDPFTIAVDDSPYVTPEEAEPPAFAERLRHALATAKHLVRGREAELARARFLAAAQCPADLERRLRTLERAEEMRRGLPLSL